MGKEIMGKKFSSTTNPNSIAINEAQLKDDVETYRGVIMNLIVSLEREVEKLRATLASMDGGSNERN